MFGHRVANRSPVLMNFLLSSVKYSDLNLCTLDLDIQCNSHALCMMHDKVVYHIWLFYKFLFLYYQIRLHICKRTTIYWLRLVDSVMASKLRVLRRTF